jgi:hypothetical protein
MCDSHKANQSQEDRLKQIDLSLAKQLQRSIELNAKLVEENKRMKQLFIRVSSFINEGSKIDLLIKDEVGRGKIVVDN